MQIKADFLELTVHQRCKYLCLGSNVTGLKAHNKVNPISAEQLTSACVNTFFMFLEGAWELVVLFMEKLSFCGQIKADPMMCLRFDAHCGYFNHLSPNMTSHSTSVLYKSIQHLQVCFTLHWSMVAGASPQPCSSWEGLGMWRDCMCFMLIKCWMRNPSVTRHHTSSCC